MNKNILYSAMIFLTLLTLFVMPRLALGATPLDQGGIGIGTGSAGDETGLASTDIRVTIAKIIRIALGFLGIIAVVLVIVGGFMWMTAAGNDEQITKAKALLMAAGIGLVIILTAYSLVTFVLSSLLSVTSDATPTTP